MSAVTLRKVFKRFGPVEVVHGIDLSINAREFVVLVGPSGCGKSTTLRMVAGLEEVSDGTIEIGGRVVNEVAPKDRDVAMVFQNYALYPHLNVAENIAFGLRLRRIKKDIITASVNDVAATLGLSELLHRRPADLSGGQRQRVAMGRAIVRQPQVFLFDEPLSNLDAKLRTQMRAEIKRLHRRLDATSIYVTHDQVEAMTLADRIVVMSDGNIEQIGTPMELFLNPINTFVAGFLGSPPMNQLEATVSYADGGPIAKVGSDIAIPLPELRQLRNAEGHPIIVGIRPEDTAVERNGAANAAGIKCDLDLVEPLGSEALVHVSVADHPVVLKTETRGAISHLSDVQEFFVQPDHIKVFDQKTGLALDHPEVA